MSTNHHQHHEQFHLNKKYTWLGVVFLILIAVLIIFLTKAYPIATVGSHFVSAGELEDSIRIAKKLEMNPDETKVKQRLFDNVKKQQLAGKVDLDAELAYYKTGREDEFNQFLNDYFGGDEDKFVKFVVAPKAHDAKLAVRYNSDFGKNNDAYNKAENIISKLNQGQSFEELAKASSDDKVSGQLGGDLGFLAAGQILPELENVINSAKLGEVKKQVVISRLGYHILYPVETSTRDGVKVWHIKHILIQTTGYESWLADQLSTVSIRRLFDI